MIAGVGTDIVKISRVECAYKKQAFRERVYTEKEQEMIGERLSRAADNWAAKEAVVKAFGTGFGRISPKEVEVLRDGRGKPFVILHDQAAAMAKEMGISDFPISIANEKEYAIAFAIALLC